MEKTVKRTLRSSDIKEQLTAQNKELIMRTAGNLFSKKGYHEISIDDIANKIGATKGLIYYYFPSKSELLAAMFIWLNDIFFNLMAPIYSSKYATPSDKLKSVIKNHIAYNCKYLVLLKFANRTRDFKNTPADIQRKIARKRSAYFKKFVSLLEEVRRSGELVDGDMDAIGSVIIWSINVLPYFYTKYKKIDIDEIAKLISNIYIGPGHDTLKPDFKNRR